MAIAQWLSNGEGRSLHSWQHFRIGLQKMLVRTAEIGHQTDAESVPVKGIFVSFYVEELNHDGHGKVGKFLSRVDHLGLSC